MRLSEYAFPKRPRAVQQFVMLDLDTGNEVSGVDKWEAAKVARCSINAVWSAARKGTVCAGRFLVARAGAAYAAREIVKSGRRWRTINQGRWSRERQPSRRYRAKEVRHG